MRPTLLTALLFTGALAAPALAADAVQTRAFVLENGMQVLLTSDPALDRSAAALSVEVGSMDNAGVEGLAHFLEHMLFLGTGKYPDSADYKDYLAQNGGMSNAYTSEEHTNYFFEVRTEAFEGALDRFSRFFIDPLMTDALSEREVNAVDSEHSKNLENDFWRMRQVYRSLLSPGHPDRGFSTGNKQSLAGVKNETLRAFYEDHYSSNLMHLAVVAPLPLDQLEGWVRAKFADVPNRGHSALKVDVPMHGDALRGHVVEVRTLNDVRDLWIKWEVPAAAFDHEAKPLQVLSAIVGHEGEESLLQSLKKDGLATSLSTGSTRIGHQGTFDLNLSLSPRGVAELDTVLARIFGTINMLRALPEVPSYVVEERQKMAEVELRFRERQAASDEARFRAATMIDYPYDDLLPSIYLMRKPSQSSVRAVLDVLTPENVVVFVGSKGRDTDQVEPWYGTGFRVTALGDARLAALRDAKAPEGVTLPSPNPFIPSDFSLVATTHAETPWVRRSEFGEVWLRHDTLFGQPKAAFEVELLNDDNWRSARDYVLGNLYSGAVRLAMNPHMYPLIEAGVTVGVSSDRRGITLSADGYSHKLPELASFVTPYMTELRISEDEFALLRGEMARGLANASKAAPTAQVFEAFRALIREVHFTPEQQAEALEAISYADLRDYFGRVNDALRVRAFFYGNLTEDAATRTVDTLLAGLAPQKALTEDEVYRGRVIRLKAGADAIVRRSIDSNDSVTMLLYQGAPADREGRAALNVLGKVLAPAFYGDLRTLQQTGYIVQSGAFEIESLPHLFLISQSSVVPTDSLRGRFVSFVAHFLEDLSKMSDEEFDAVRATAVADLVKKSTSYTDELQRNVMLAFLFHGDFADTEKQVAATQALSRERWIELARNMLGDGACRVSLQLDGRPDRMRFRELPLDAVRAGAEGWFERPRNEK